MFTISVLVMNRQSRPICLKFETILTKIQYNKLYFIWFRFYGPFKIISLISSRSLIRGERTQEYSEKNNLTFFCRTWRLTCDPSQARTTAVRDLMIKSQRSYPLGHEGPLINYIIFIIYHPVIWNTSNIFY